MQPLAPGMNNNLVHAMRAQWNLPLNYNQNPYLPQNMGLDLPFFPPQEITALNPILMNWDPLLNNMQPQVPINLGPMNQEVPPPQMNQNLGNPVEEGIEEEVNLVGELLVESTNLDELKVYLFEEMQEKRLILACPVSLFKFTMDMRPPQDLTVGKIAMILVPSLRRNPIFPQGSQWSATTPTPGHESC